MMLGKTPRRLLLTMAVAAVMLLGSAAAHADTPVNPDIAQGGIGNIDVVQNLVEGLLAPLSQQ